MSGLNSSAVNTPAPGTPYFTPNQEPPADWHFAHLSQFMIHGNALTIVEATAATSHGGITPQDSANRDLCAQPRPEDRHSTGTRGRKANTVDPWLVPLLGDVRAIASAEHGGWPDNVWAPSAIKFADGYATPKAMTTEDIQSLMQGFTDAAARSVKAGFDVIEIHAAHGYLLTEFLSPITDQRSDAYGGSFENRTRLLFEVISAVRSVVPDTMPLFLRISAIEWMEWGDQPSCCRLLARTCLMSVRVATTQNKRSKSILIIRFIAGQIRDTLKKEGLPLSIGAVGMITEAEMARLIVQETEQVPDGVKQETSTLEVEQEGGQKTQAASGTAATARA
ncbi:uncharacterized protein BCR38DRAFT_458840 [Pseudomassariella vexata]|uniref:NADH:flavin oxidoreductase/NADH oxidase N-terminal domain-containing protein n=1 Tax=Pseudomassariella vexata TaxID=1141098 RepID=A0A1Y2DSK6_9PEZI|nr:uncharacterized protein BCR38DRAFT_458840 [Pseudomassariella vexata]ORY62271.1 hypothetical protein BCR38DRAFT_458840 [Pseudomassariella vexata]